MGWGVYQFSLLIDDLISRTVASCRTTGHKLILYLHNQSRRCRGWSLLSPSLSLSLRVVSQTRLSWLSCLINAGFILLSVVQKEKSL